MKLDRSLFLALILFIASMAFWENHVRKLGYIAAIDDDKALWAVQRSKLKEMGPGDVVVIGSSRSHFDIQLDIWERKTGRRPLMLSNDGASPTPVFKDIVENTGFNGTVLIGVAPGLFFSKPIESAWMWHRAQVRVDFYYKRTLAQRINHQLAIPLQQSFAFLNGAEEQWDDDIDLKSIIKRIHIGGDRLGNQEPPFYNFSYVDLDRNTTMFAKTVKDTAFANTIKRFWMFGADDRPPADKSVIAVYEELIPKLRSRGGDVIFVRFPSSGDFLAEEKKRTPRKEFWDQLLERTNSRGYYFEDYPELSKYVIPEWSHLATPDARKFTADLVRIMQQDNALPNP